MSEMKLEVCDGENVCSWCFEVGETVLRHVDTDTYWHQRSEVPFYLGNAGLM